MTRKTTRVMSKDSEGEPVITRTLVTPLLKKTCDHCKKRRKGRGGKEQPSLWRFFRVRPNTQTHVFKGLYCSSGCFFKELGYG